MINITGWFLLKTHKNNLCKPFHSKHNNKVWCPVVAKVYFMWKLEALERNR